ncbi:hypothetical protein DUHN55_43990 [Helicobacter pylori]
MSLTWAEAARLAAKGGRADRLRRWLIAGCAALAVSLLASAAAVPGYWDRERRFAAEDYSYLGDLLAQPGLAFGVGLALALLAVPVIHLAMQAVRVGAPERDRRLAGMRAAGATPSDVRAVLRAEALAWTGIGCLAGLVVWAAVLGLISRRVTIEYSANWNGVEEGIRPLLVVLWPSWWLLVLAAAVVVAVAATLLPLSARRVTVSTRDTFTPEPEMSRALGLSLMVSLAATAVGLLALVVVNAALQGASQWGARLTVWLGGLVLVSGVALLICSLAAGAPAVARRVAGGLDRGRGPSTFIAARLMRAHPRLASRTAVSLVLVAFVGGMAIPIEGLLRASSVANVERNGEAGPGGAELSPDVLTYVVPATAVEVLVALAAVLGVVGLLVAVREQVTLRGPMLARQIAHGVPARVLRRALILEAVGPTAVMTTVAMACGAFVSMLLGVADEVPSFVGAVAWDRFFGLWVLLVAGATLAAGIGCRRVGSLPQGLRARE